MAITRKFITFNLNGQVWHTDDGPEGPLTVTRINNPGVYRVAFPASARPASTDQIICLCHAFAANETSGSGVAYWAKVIAYTTTHVDIETSYYLGTIRNSDCCVELVYEVAP